MRIRLLFIFSLLCLFIAPELVAQNVFINKEKIMEELDKRGLEYSKVEAALNEKGIDLKFIDQSNITQEQINVIQEVILEMEAEQAKLEDEEDEEGEKSDDEKELDEDEMEKDSLDLEGELDEELKEEELPEITIFGQGLFRNKVLQVQPRSEELKAPDSYVIGPGDDLAISAWGRSQFDHEYRVGSDGYIRILEDRKRVFVKGLTLGSAREKLFKVFSKSYYFNSGEFDVSLNYSRTVKVSIYGEVAGTQGTFAIPAFNSAFNALAAVHGTNDIGSLRKIQLRKASGDTKLMDIYAFMANPAIASNYYLEENDIIVVPVAEKIINLEGAVRRPYKYELIDREGLRELLTYSGGFAENAFQKKIQIHRFEDDGKKILDVDWREYERANRNFELFHGDHVIVEEIETEYNNFVEIIGEVSKPGIFQRSTGMKIADLIKKAGVTELSSTGIVYLTRDNYDGTFEYKKLNLEAILNNKSSTENLLLKDRDKIEIWAKGRFKDEIEIAIDGAVRFPGKFPYDTGKTMKVRDAITLAGGLRRDASNFAIIHRNDPLNPKVKSYKTINNLEELLDGTDMEGNFILDPYDSLVVKSKNTFLEESYVRIEGAVNAPGEYQYGQNMSIKDLMTLAGGFKMAASTNNIEISRVIIHNNEPTTTVVANLEMDRNFDVISSGADGDYRLEPYDNIAVRYIKEFELQRRVFLEGEVHFPGPYAISKENEKILSILERAGGLTDEAFPSGATLERNDQEYGNVVIKLEEIIKNPISEFNFHVKNGDRIFVPKIKEFVTVRGATRAYEAVGEDKINEGNEIHVPFHRNKDAMYYINEYAGGLHESADKAKIFVEHANGEIKRPTQGFLRKRFPKVYRGSEITVGFKSFDKNEEDQKSNVDWTKVLGDSVAQAMSILTLILLIGRIE